MKKTRFERLKAELSAHPKDGILFPTIDLTEASDEVLEALDACERIGGQWGVEILCAYLAAMEPYTQPEREGMARGFCGRIALTLGSYRLAQWLASSPSLYERRRVRLEAHLKTITPEEAAHIYWPHADIDDGTKGPVYEVAMIQSAADEWAEAIEAALTCPKA